MHLLCRCRPLDSNIYFNRSCLPYASEASSSSDKTLSVDIEEDELNSSDASRIVTILIRQGIALNNKNSDGLTILDLISKNFVHFGEDLASILQIVIASGARPDDSSSLTALRGQFLFVDSAVQSGIVQWDSKGILGSEGIDLQYDKLQTISLSSVQFQ